MSSPPISYLTNLGSLSWNFPYLSVLRCFTDSFPPSLGHSTAHPAGLDGRAQGLTSSSLWVLFANENLTLGLVTWAQVATRTLPRAREWSGALPAHRHCTWPLATQRGRGEGAVMIWTLITRVGDCTGMGLDGSLFTFQPAELKWWPQRVWKVWGRDPESWSQPARQRWRAQQPPQGQKGLRKADATEPFSISSPQKVILLTRAMEEAFFLFNAFTHSRLLK